MDSDPKLHPLLSRDLDIALGDDILELDGGLNRIGGRRELDEGVVPGGVDDPAPAPVDDRAQLAPVLSERGDRHDLILGHEPAVARDVHGCDRNQLPNDIRIHGGKLPALFEGCRLCALASIASRRKEPVGTYQGAGEDRCTTAASSVRRPRQEGAAISCQPRHRGGGA